MTKKTVSDILFLLIVTAICHLLFSPYGFNPTDEGFVLSATNRVLHGQIPHIDFSSVRPLGYAYLHLPELLISKTHFFLVSRFVFWLEQTLIAYLWIQFLISHTKIDIPSFFRYALVLICFIFNVHYFPCSVLHTIDGLLMCVIGLNIIISEKKWNFTGFIFIGFAALCKQNYLVILPVTLFIFGRKNIVLNVISGLIPIVSYTAFISIRGGWNDLATQLSGHNELIKVGILSYLFNPMVYIGFLGIFIHHKIKTSKIQFTVLILLFAIALLITNHYHGKYVYVFLGIICGESAFRFIQKESVILPIITILIAWSVSISVGYNTPALFIGGIISLLLFCFFLSSKTALENKFFYAVLPITLIAFYFARTQNIYRDLPAKKLTYKLDNLVEGASGIYTNKNTYLVLQELDSLKKEIPDLVVVPDFTACNILHSHKSKILTEWPNKTEIPNNQILEKVISEIKSDTGVEFAIPVFQTALLKDGFTLQENNGLNYPIVKFTKEHYPKFSFTTYFELRKK